MLFNSEYISLVLIPIVVGLLEIVKKAELFNAKFIPIVSLAFGLLAGIFFSGFNLKEGALIGIYIGLSAVGLYSGTTNVVEGIKQRK